MRRSIYLLVIALAALSTAAAQDAARKDHYTVGKQLYEARRWSAARYELAAALETLGPADLTRRMEIEALRAFCGARLGQTEAGDIFADLLTKYPASPFNNEIRFRAGVFEYDSGWYSRALDMFEGVDARRLDRADIDEFNFKKGHSLFETGDREMALVFLSRVGPNNLYSPHAEYYLAYIDYEKGNYAEAKRRFSDLAAHPAYGKIVPYYLIQIEFLEGNYRYVVEQADAVIEHAAEARRTELMLMTAQSWFHLGDYRKVLEYIDRYKADGGRMGREQNYLEGYALYRETRYGEAVEALQQAAGVDDGLSQNAAYHLADAYLKLGDKQRAMQSFSIASAEGYDPAIAEDALFNYGKLQYELGGGHFNEAINVLNRYLELYPASPRVHQVREYLIAAYFNSRDYEAAYNAIVQYPDPDNNIKAALQKVMYFRALELWGQGDADEAQRLLEASSNYRYNTKYTALASFWQGEILYSEGRYAEAEAKYREYLRLSPTSEPENVMARYNLGYTAFNTRQWNEALKWFDDFLSRYSTPDSYRADAFNREGDIHHAQRAYWKAIESYDKAAAVGTAGKYYSEFQRAMMLGLVDRPERKIETLQTIIRRNEGPYVERAAYELGRTYIVHERYSEGASALTSFIAKYPRSEHYPAALSNLGLAYLNMGDREQSMKYYKMIVDRAPRSREAQDAMAGIRGLYVDANDVDAYIDYARRSGIKTDTGDIQRDSLSFVAAERIYLSGDSRAAVPALEGYVRNNADGHFVPAALYFLAEAQIQNGDTQGALANLRQLAGLETNDYTLRGLQRLADLGYRAGLYEEAAAVYRRLSGVTTDPGIVSAALSGYVAAVIAGGGDERIIAMADEVASLQGVPEAALRSASFAKANALKRQGRTTEAIEIYRRLAENVRTPEGSESAYRVIENLYEEGYYRQAEDAVFAFSDRNPDSYWLGMAFLTLGDTYVKIGDTFQARATYQSIVDGYSNKNDGVIEQARERIANLK